MHKKVLFGRTIIVITITLLVGGALWLTSRLTFLTNLGNIANSKEIGTIWSPDRSYAVSFVLNDPGATGGTVLYLYTSKQGQDHTLLKQVKLFTGATVKWNEPKKFCVVYNHEQKVSMGNSCEGDYVDYFEV